MDRRSFLRTLGLLPAAVYIPKVTYSFLGGILRPRPYTATDVVRDTEAFYERWEWKWQISERGFRDMNPHLSLELMELKIKEIRQANASIT